MSVVDPVVLGDCKFIPGDFNGTNVTVEVHVLGEAQDDDGQEWQATHHPDNGPGLVVMPIKRWESLQRAGAQVVAYEAAFAQQNGGQG